MKVVSIILISVGFLLMLIGLLMKKTKKIEFINQVDEIKKYNRDKLSAFAGNNLLIMGAIEVLLGCISFVVFSQTESPTMLLGTIIISFAILLFFSLKVALGVKKYEL